MKAIVTGGAGFIGSHLAEALVSEGAEVHVIDNLVTGNPEYVPPGAALHKLDIRQEETKEFIMSLQPDVVFHQAAQVDVQRSVRQPDYDAGVNIAGTVNILEACRLASVNKFIFASSCAVYGDQPVDMIREETRQQPISYYGLSKLTCEWYIELFHQLYGLSYTILRYANVYGPRQTAKGEGGVVAIFLQRLASGQPVTVFGDGEQTRDFVYVKDVVSANMAAVRKGDQQTIQVSTGIPTSINKLVEMVRGIHGEDIEVRYEPERPGDIRNSCLANDKAARELSWKPKYSLHDGLLESYLSVKSVAANNIG
ncbi:NAD-dependent epimerase/dehydratase family protein [Paenibacillus alkalitolerans]|uniref:NAD-dependent epimerase/dehydratase family protein n=1 Tax=Paenibacillus alkalitolerans TaxID=2799335 RepID=UPI0018F410AE|nr:NAD-dependent epimerase/dehydratase family protein [Paenibacillus alkalitolerans]